MYLNLEGDWTVTLTTKEGTQKGKVSLPGIIQAQGYGEKITKQTPWEAVSMMQNGGRGRNTGMHRKMDAESLFCHSHPGIFWEKSFMKER